MPSLEAYRQALERMHEADEARRKAFNKIGSWRSGDEKGVAKAKKLLEEFHAESKRLHTQYIEPLERRFFSGEPEAIDEVIAVLSIIVQSFGSGYRKEDYYRRLKKADLSVAQVSKLKQLVLQRCASNEYRREDLELRRLMIKLADIDFLKEIAAIAARTGSRVEGHKARMLQVILQGRKDLRDQPKLRERSEL